MRKIYCTNCKKYKELKRPKVSYKYHILSSICAKSGSEDIKKYWSEILRIFGLINNM